MSIFIILTVIQAVVAAMLIGVILMQKSEGGGLGTGGSPAGLMSARGAADLLTRTTSVLATLFVALSIVLAALAVKASGGRQIDDSLSQQAPAGAPPAGTAPLLPPGTAPGAAPGTGLAPGTPASPAPGSTAPAK